jgi:hypothetical protein
VQFAIPVHSAQFAEQGTQPALVPNFPVSHPYTNFPEESVSYPEEGTKHLSCETQIKQFAEHGLHPSFVPNKPASQLITHIPF